MAMPNKELKCPNCGATCAAKDDGSCVCAACGGSFTFHDGEARLTDIGEYDRLKGRVDAIEAGQADLRELLGKPAQLPAPGDDPADPSEPADDEPPDDEDPEIEDDDDEEDW